MGWVALTTVPCMGAHLQKALLPEGPTALCSQNSLEVMLLENNLSSTRSDRGETRLLTRARFRPETRAVEATRLCKPLARLIPAAGPLAVTRATFCMAKLVLFARGAGPETACWLFYERYGTIWNSWPPTNIW